VVNLIANYDLKQWRSCPRRPLWEVSTMASQQAGVNQATIAALTAVERRRDPVPGSPAGNKQVIQNLPGEVDYRLGVTYAWTSGLRFLPGVNNLFNVYPTENIRSRVVGGVAFTGSDNVGIFPINSISPFGFNGASTTARVNYKF